MPYGEDFLDGDLSPPLIQSDLFGLPEPEYPANQDLAEGASVTVVTLDERTELAAGVPEANMDIDVEGDVEAHAPPSTIKKRGRPSLSGSATPARSVTAKTPRSTKSTATPKSASRSTGKREAPEPEPVEDEPQEDEPEEDEPEATPAAKRGRPARSAGAPSSARLAAKAAKKPTRGRPKAATTTAKPAKKAGRAKKASTNGEVPEGEYEVEEIVDSAIDADTHVHMYLVKWKNYPASDNTWEPKTNLGHSVDLLRKFDARKRKTEAAAAAKKAAAKKAAAPAGEEKKAGRGRKTKAAKPVKKAPGRPGRKKRGRA